MHVARLSLRVSRSPLLILRSFHSLRNGVVNGESHGENEGNGKDIIVTRILLLLHYIKEYTTLYLLISIIS